jgi:Lamin Tail Domain
MNKYFLWAAGAVPKLKNNKKVAVCAGFMALFLAGAGMCVLFPSSASALLGRGAAFVVESWQNTVGGGQSNDFAWGDALQTDEVSASGTTLSDDDMLSAAQDASSTVGMNVGGVAAVTGIRAKATPAPSSPNNPVFSVSSSASSAATPSLVHTSPAPLPLPSALPSPPPACVVSAAMASSHKIILNEIAWMGAVTQAGETASAASGHEWVELKNISSDTADLSSWQLADLSGNMKIIFPHGATIAAGGFYLLARNASSVGAVAANQEYAGDLSNGGDMLALFDAGCNGSDLVDASHGWPAGNNTTKATMERNADGVGWHTSVSPGGTPGQENSVIVNAVTATNADNLVDPVPQTPMPAPAPSPVVIAAPALTPTPAPASSSTPAPDPTATPASTPTQEPSASPSPTQVSSAPNHMMIAAIALGSASSSANDLVRIFNPTGSTVDVSGWKLRKKTSTGSDDSLKEFPSGSSVASGAYFVWANSADGYGDAIHANVTSTGTLAADNSVALFDANGTIVDAVAWGTGTNQYVEAAPYPKDPATGQTLTRLLLNGALVDSDDNANDFTIQ